jgi:hypothetical protein
VNDLNDYLDGRMGPEEHEAFERRLQGDPELERRVKEAREVHDALREGDEELSPGFYARAVARFEAERRPRSPLPFGLSWSTAGLAVAGLAAAAIFIPMMLRGELTPQIEERRAERVESAKPADLKDETSKLSEEQTDAVSALGYAEGAPDDESKNEAARGLAETEPAAANEPAPAQAKKKQEQPAAPPPVEFSQPKAPSKAAAAAEVPVYSARGKNLNLLSESSGVAAMTLPGGFVDPGSVKIAGGAADQDSYTVHGNDDARARERVDASGRFLLIGRRAGLDSCGELRMVELPTHWEVSYDESGSAEGQVECGLLIPDDDREIRFMGRRVDG